MSLIQHQRGREGKRRDCNCQQQIPLRTQQQVPRLLTAERDMLQSCQVSDRDRDRDISSSSWLQGKKPSPSGLLFSHLCMENLGHGFSRRKNERL